MSPLSAKKTPFTHIALIKLVQVLYLKLARPLLIDNVHSFLCN